MTISRIDSIDYHAHLGHLELRFSSDNIYMTEDRPMSKFYFLTMWYCME